MKFFNIIAPFFDLAMKVVGHSDSLEKVAERIDFSEGDKLLDLGGGTGQLLNYIPEEVDVTILDSSEKMLERARNKVKRQNIEYVKGRGDNMPFPDHIFDHIVIVDAFHHFNQVDTTIMELSRVIKPSGQLYILEYTPESNVTRLISAGENLVGEPANFFRPSELIDIIKNVGFEFRKPDISGSTYILEGIYTGV
ncbi:MAG: class I SAM-dependent methyltransferase [Halanaerobiaceae bacterium]